MCNQGTSWTVSDGTATKTHEVMNLFITDVDFATDEVFGTADAGTDVEGPGSRRAARVADRHLQTAPVSGPPTSPILAGEGGGIADLAFNSDASAKPVRRRQRRHLVCRGACRRSGSIPRTTMSMGSRVAAQYHLHGLTWTMTANLGNGFALRELTADTGRLGELRYRCGRTTTS